MLRNWKPLSGKQLCLSREMNWCKLIIRWTVNYSAAHNEWIGDKGEEIGRPGMGGPQLAPLSLN